MNLKLLAWDSEMISSVGMPSPYKNPILIISLATESESKLLILTDEEYAKKDDRRIIQEFIKYIYDNDFDCILTYNGSMFDWPYIQKRAELHGMALKLGRDGSEIRFSRSGLYETVDIIGRLNEIGRAHV